MVGGPHELSRDMAVSDLFPFISTRHPVFPTTESHPVHVVCTVLSSCTVVPCVYVWLHCSVDVPGEASRHEKPPVPLIVSGAHHGCAANCRLSV